jgi:DNA (cytosine-5)-methyltransferase 1
MTGTKPIYYTSLFANVGIGEYYLKELGLVGAVANELLPRRAKWHKEVYPDCEMVIGDFSDPAIFDEVVRLHKENNCSLVLASPVCKTFSIANRSRDITADKRTFLFQDTLRFIEATNPQWVLIENVPQFLTAKPDNLNGQTIKEFLTAELSRLGYSVNIAVQDASFFGTPQARKRAILLASKTGKWEFPKPDPKQLTVREVIGNLPSLEAGENSDIPFHNAPRMSKFQAEVMKHTPTGCSAFDNPVWKPVKSDGTPSYSRYGCSFRRKDWDKPSPTILCNSRSIYSYTNVHPGRLLPDGTYSDARCMTILELLRLFGLPDNYPIPKWAKPCLVREILGESFAARHVQRILSELPRES